MTIDEVKKVLEQNSQDLTKEFKRVFHGRALSTGRQNHYLMS